jgi:plasmid stability protein
MASITVSELPDEVYSALRIRAAKSGRSIESEVREILRDALIPARRLKLFSALAALGDRYAVTSTLAEITSPIA